MKAFLIAAAIAAIPTYFVVKGSKSDAEHACIKEFAEHNIPQGSDIEVERFGASFQPWIFCIGVRDKAVHPTGIFVVWLLFLAGSYPITKTILSDLEDER